MKLFASLLAAAILSVPALSAHADVINPLVDGFKIQVGSTVLTNANASYNPFNHSLIFSDLTSTYTFAEIDAAPLVNALSITRTCLTLNFFGYGCGTSTIAISNASVLNGTIQASLLVGATLNATATAGVSDLVFAKSNLGLAVQTALVGFDASVPPPPVGTSPVPEPGTLGMVATGLLGAAGAVRRRFLA